MYCKPVSRNRKRWCRLTTAQSTSRLTSTGDRHGCPERGGVCTSPTNENAAIQARLGMHDPSTCSNTCNSTCNNPLVKWIPLTFGILLLLPIAGGQRSPLRVMHGPVQARRPCSPGTAELMASTPTQQAQVLRPGQCYSLKGRMVRCVKGRSRRHGPGAVCEAAQLAACARCGV